MKKMLSLLAVLTLTLAGCGASSSTTITMGGSTSVAPLIIGSDSESGLANDYMAENPGIDITYDSNGSSAGVKGVNDGTYQIGASSRELKEDEITEGLVVDVVANDGIAIVTNPANPVTDLTTEQVLGIYTGEITNWSEVGGEDMAISVVSREDGSGTRDAFEEIVGFGDLEKDQAPLVEGASISSANGDVATNVSQNEAAIGYVSFDVLADADVTPVNIDGFAPTPEEVVAGNYPISRPFILMYKEDAPQEVLDYMAWVDENANDYAESFGLIPVK